nr:NADH dehydrogenase subunit 6 [Platypleura kaempferi]AWV84482.1 NADH dehydrogenase subunit 6 [Platypleura kaempferi]
MKMLSLMILILSTNFMFMQHPLSMGSILLILTILSCLLSSLMLNSYLLSYILFLVFIGGMLVLFMYMASIASNEKFYFSMKLLSMNVMLMLILMFLNMNFSFITCLLNDMNNYYEWFNYMMNKLYSFPYGNLSLMMMIYLLFTMIVIVNIVSLKMAPLRSS